MRVLVALGNAGTASCGLDFRARRSTGRQFMRDVRLPPTAAPGSATATSILAYPRYYLAVDSATAAAGSAICRSTLTDPGNGCVPLNPFKRLTAKEIDYLRYTSDWATTTLTQQVLSAYASGGLFDLPGGEVQMVFGGEYRSATTSARSRNTTRPIPPATPAWAQVVAGTVRRGQQPVRSGAAAGAGCGGGRRQFRAGLPRRRVRRDRAHVLRRDPPGAVSGGRDSAQIRMCAPPWRQDAMTYR